MAQLLGLRGPWWRQVCGDTDCLHCRTYGPTRAFFPASCSWRSEGLCGQSFSVALPLQALRGLRLGSFSIVPRLRHIEGPPWLGSFSVGRRLRHIEGPPLAGVLLCRLARQALKGAPWVGSYSVVQGVRPLMGQPLCCSTADAGGWGERGYGDGSTPYT